MNKILQRETAMEKQGKCLTSFQRKLLEKSLQTKGLRREHRRRIRIMLLADEGLTKAKISRTLKCTQETARYWIGLARAGQAHNWRDCPRGRPKIINDEYSARLKELVQGTPRDYGYSFERWTGQWLSKHLNKELGIKISSVHVNRLLKQMGLSTRPRSTSDDLKIDDKSTENLGFELRELSSDSVSASTPQWPPNFLD